MLSLHATVTCGLCYLAVGAMIWAIETARGKYALSDFALEVMVGGLRDRLVAFGAVGDREGGGAAGMRQDMVQATTSVAPAGCDHPTAATWAARITERWRSSVEAIIATGRLLIEAKDALAHGAFGAMCETQLPFSASTAQRLMAVARDLRLSNPAHVQHLPASWGTLYELTKLSDDEFSSAIAQQVIRPDMLRGEAELIRPLTHQKLESSSAVEPDAVNVPVAGSIPASPANDSEFAGAVEQPSRDNKGGPMGLLSSGEIPGPGTSQMPSGGLAIAHNRVEPGNSLDFFPTPPWATRALVEHVLPHLDRRDKHCRLQRAWEPACGEGHMAEVLREYFRDVLATDIADYGYGDDTGDFLAAARQMHPEFAQVRVDPRQNRLPVGFRASHANRGLQTRRLF